MTVLALWRHGGRVFLLGDLNLDPIRHNQHVHQCCGWFIIYLTNIDINKEVSLGLEHNWISSPFVQQPQNAMTCREPDQDQNTDNQVKALWDLLHLGLWRDAHTCILPANGGQLRDGYVPYPASKVISQENIHSLVAHALVCPAVMWALQMVEVNEQRVLQSRT